MQSGNILKSQHFMRCLDICNIPNNSCIRLETKKMWWIAPKKRKQPITWRHIITSHLQRFHTNYSFGNRFFFIHLSRRTYNKQIRRKKKLKSWVNIISIHVVHVCSLFSAFEIFLFCRLFFILLLRRDFNTKNKMNKGNHSKFTQEKIFNAIALYETNTHVKYMKKKSMQLFYSQKC